MYIYLFILLGCIHLYFVYYVTNDFVYYVTNIINPIFNNCSLIGDEIYYDNNTLEESKILQKNWKMIRDEALSTYKNYSTIKGDLFFEDDVIKDGDKWKKLYFKWYSDIDEKARKLCPKTSKLIESMPNIKFAMFSVLYPGAEILPHTGPYKGCLIHHLGLKTPKNDKCFISVDNKKYHWKDGEGILFDDTRLHYVKNNTDEIRIILLCGMIRPMSFIGDTLSKTMLNIYGPITGKDRKN
jgi:beta-hydroxylase